MIRLVVFDLDGTLADAAEDLATGVNRAFARLAPGTLPLAVPVIRSYIGSGATVLLARSAEAAGLERTAEEILPVFLYEYGKCLLDTTRLYPGVREALEALRAPVGPPRRRGTPGGDGVPPGRTLAVLTNKPGDLSRRLLDGLGVGDLFTRVYGGGDLPTRKPDPAGILRLREESGVSAHETVLVGDSAIDVATARAARVRCVGVTWGFGEADLEADPPELIVDDPRDLPAAIARLDVPSR